MTKLGDTLNALVDLLDYHHSRISALENGDITRLIDNIMLAHAVDGTAAHVVAEMSIGECGDVLDYLRNRRRTFREHLKGFGGTDHAFLEAEAKMWFAHAVPLLEARVAGTAARRKRANAGGIGERHAR
jgi:hypothetical protein